MPNLPSFCPELIRDYPMVLSLLSPRNPSHENPDHYILPDLVSDCPFSPRYSPYCEPISRESEKWFLAAANYDEEKTLSLLGLKAGVLTSACYPDADEFHLRVVADYLNWLFNLDDWTDDFDVDDTAGMRKCCMAAMRDPINFETDKRAGIMTKSYFSRFLTSARPGCRERFIYTMDLFFQAVVQQSVDRSKGITPDLESYIDVRRDTSGCKSCFQLIEFVGQYDLPDEVVQHPLIQRMEQSTNDLVTWSNDLFSYNKEQVRNDTHNMIPVTMEHYGLGFQEAVDFVGAMCSRSVANFEHDRKLLPSWGPEVDKIVEKYVDGLQNWIVGSLYWSFTTERYFAKCGQEVKGHRYIKLSPKAALN